MVVKLYFELGFYGTTQKQVNRRSFKITDFSA